MSVLTIDRLIELLESAKETIGGDKPVVLHGKDGQMMIIFDGAEDPVSENFYRHFSAVERPPTSFGFSTWTSGEWIQTGEVTLDEIEGRKPIPSAMEMFEKHLKEKK